MAASEAAAAGAVVLNDRFEIVLANRIPGLSSSTGDAFAVRSIRDYKGDAYAVVCKGDVPPRMEMLSVLRSVDHAGLLYTLEGGVVDWPSDGSRRFAFVFERPGGNPLMASLDHDQEPMAEDQLFRAIILPMVSVLLDLSGRGIVHGGIRPTNIFHRDASPSRSGRASRRRPASTSRPCSRRSNAAWPSPPGAATGRRPTTFMRSASRWWR